MGDQHSSAEDDLIDAISADSTPLETMSPVDALRMVLAVAWFLVFVILELLFGDEIIDFFSDVLAGFRVVNETFVTVVAIGTRLGTLGLLLAGVVLALRGGRGRFLLTTVAGGALAGVLVLLTKGIFDAVAAPVLPSDEVLGYLGDRAFPSAVGLGVVTGIVAAGVPWTARRWRRLGWLLVAFLAVQRALTAPLSFETFAAVAVGAFAGALVDAVLGTPSRRPTKAAVIEGLTRAGVHLAELDVASVDARGSTPYFGVTEDGTRLFVKALGADERKADLLFRIVRSINPHDLGDERPFSSLRRAVEHEALVALAADQVGVRTPPLAGFASAEPGGFVLSYVAIAGKSLDGVEPERLTDEVLAGIWEQMGILRGHGIAHRDLRLANVFLADDGVVWFIDFGFSELAASDLLLSTDLAELVTSLSFKVGAERAVAAAAAAVGPDALLAALPRFKSSFLAGATRTALKEQPGHMDDLRQRVQALQVPGVKRTQALATAGVGAAVFAVATHLAADDDAQAPESRVFHAINGLPGWLYPVLWAPMQLGNLVVGAVVALAVALVGRRPKVAVAVLAATGLKLVVEKVIRAELSAEFLDHRRRPGTSQEDAVLRGDVPVDGYSFPSGHVILVAALAAVLTPLLPRRWATVPWALVGAVAFGRVYVGAHNPLDVTAGFALGLSVGSMLDAVLGDANVHWSQQSAPLAREWLSHRHPG